MFVNRSGQYLLVPHVPGKWRMPSPRPPWLLLKRNSGKLHPSRWELCIENHLPPFSRNIKEWSYQSDENKAVQPDMRLIGLIPSLGIVLSRRRQNSSAIWCRSYQIDNLLVFRRGRRVQKELSGMHPRSCWHGIRWQSGIGVLYPMKQWRISLIARRGSLLEPANP